MARFFMYVPWEDDKAMLDGAGVFDARMEKLGAYESTHVITAEHLEDAEIAPEDGFYIAGECAANIEYIGSKHGKKLTVAQLADQLVDELPQDMRAIHIWACYSGHGMQGVTEGRQVGLAFKFWEEMHRRNFHQLAVYGYRFAVLDPFSPKQADLLTAQVLPGFKSLSETPEKVKILPGSASNWMTGIAADGTIIAPRALPRPITMAAIPK